MASMKRINGIYAVYTSSSGIVELSSNENINVYANLELKSKSVYDNTATIEVKLYFKHNTANVPVTNSIQNGYIILNGVRKDFNWNPLNYSGGNSYISTGTLIELFNGEINIDYGNETSELIFDVNYYCNINPNGAFRYIKGSGNMTIPKITNSHFNINNIWKKSFFWFNKYNIWKRCIVWKNINGIWKKGK